MLNWFLRPVIIAAAAIAAWFVARDAVNFTLIETVVALLLVTGLVAVAALWETFSDWRSGRKKGP